MLVCTGNNAAKMGGGTAEFHANEVLEICNTAVACCGADAVAIFPMLPRGDSERITFANEFNHHVAQQDAVPVLGIRDWPCHAEHEFNVGVRDHHLTDEHVSLLAPYLCPWVATHLDHSDWIPDYQRWWYHGKRCFLDKPPKVNGRCTDEVEVRQEEVDDGKEIGVRITFPMQKERVAKVGPAAPSGCG